MASSRQSKRKVPVFLLLVGLMLAALVAAFIWSSSRPKPTSEVQLLDTNGEPRKVQIPVGASRDAALLAKSKLENVALQWADTIKLASSTPRIQLSGVVSDMQRQSRDLAAMAKDLPPCHQRAAEYLLASERHTIDGFLSFMRESNEEMQKGMEKASIELRNYQMTLNACLPEGAPDSVNNASPKASAVNVEHPRKRIDRASFRGTWPFITDTASITCLPGPTANTNILIVELANQTFALNGIAKGQGYPDVDPYWANNMKIPGAKLFIGDVIKAGLGICA